MINKDWIVLKFGGTSVAGAPQWLTIRGLLQQRLAQGHRVLLVCSAVSGITNRLAALAENPHESAIEALLDIHHGLARELAVPESAWLEPAQHRLHDCVNRLQQGQDFAAQADLLALGEWLSTRIGAAFLGQSLEISWMDVRQHLVARAEPELSPARQWLSASCEPGLDSGFVNHCADLGDAVITQGYAASNAAGETVLLGRGGSDTSAALLAGRLGARAVEIWTDVPGLFSADPRQIEQARLLKELDFAEALEMAASGAKVVHPSCIRAAEATSTDIIIRDTGKPDFSGTRIAHLDHREKGVKTITCQNDMVVLLLQKIDARREVGFLAGVFEVFRRRGISIDLVATSETTTTVALNQAANLLDTPMLNSLVDELREQCMVVVHTDCVCVNLVGRGVRTALSRMSASMAYFERKPLLMLSQSANDLCLSLLFPAGDHQNLVKQLHDEILNEFSSDAASASEFGPSWQELQRWE